MDCVYSVRARRLLGFLSVSCVSSVASARPPFWYQSGCDQVTVAGSSVRKVDACCDRIMN